jgi:RNA polymerase sigma factor (sigma-70 family)
VIAARPSLASHAARSWHRHACSARVFVIRPCLAPPARPRPEDHLGLVGTLARAYARKFPHCGLEVEDLMQEGWFGLRIACERFNPGRGVKFSAYARWWIRAAIVGTIEDQPHPVRVPRGVRHFGNREWEGTLDPITGLGARDRARLDDARPFLAAPPVQEAGLRDSSFIDRSTPDDDGVSQSLAELAVDHRAAVPAAEDLDDPDGTRPLRVPITDDRLRLRDALAALTGRERDALRLRFGFEGGEPLAQAQVAARLGVTRQTACKIQVRALRRLRAMLGAAPPGRHQRKGGSSCSY